MKHVRRLLLPSLLGLLSLVPAAAAEPAPAAPPAPCVFCEIVAGRMPAATVYRDDQVCAFLSIGPRNPGHLLVIPVAHAENFLAVPAATMHAMTDTAHRLVEALRRTDLKMEGFNLQMNSGAAAGQTVFHAHLHIIPRFAGEPPAAGREERRPLADLEPVAAKIRAALAEHQP